METDSFLGSDLFFPSNFLPFNHDDDDLCIDAMLNGEDIFKVTDEFQLPSTHETVVTESNQQENFAHGFQEPSLTDLLLLCAEAVESENLLLASSLIARLEYLLLNAGTETSPFLRLAFLFTQALRSVITGNRPVAAPHAWLSTKEDMSAYQLLQELSPFVKFAHFTANQAILEATGDDSEVHIIDFDIMEGIQWPSLMVDLANRNVGALLRIIAVVADDKAPVVHRTGQRLLEFANSIGLTIRFDQVGSKDLEGLLQTCGGSVIANCVVQQSQTSSNSLASMQDFLGIVRKLKPKMVVLAEEELFRSTKSKSMRFVEFFCEALHHFGSVSDSLACSFYGGYKAGLRLVEKEMLGPRIMDCLTYFPSGPFSMEGFKMSPPSSCNVSQAKYLLGLFNRGFSAQHENGRLALWWKSRPLVSVSTWVPA